MSGNRDNPEEFKILPAGYALIGWKESVDFPEWGLKRIRVKVDTGACTSALGVVNYQIEQGSSGGAVIHLEMALKRGRPDRLTLVDTPLVGTVRVKNPGGRKEERPVIEALVRLGTVVKRIRMTITRRCAMRYPILLGRQGLAGHFVVDVTQRYLLRAQ